MAPARPKTSERVISIHSNNNIFDSLGHGRAPNWPKSTNLSRICLVKVYNRFLIIEKNNFFKIGLTDINCSRISRKQTKILPKENPALIWSAVFHLHRIALIFLIVFLTNWNPIHLLSISNLPLSFTPRPIFIRISKTLALLKVS